MKVYLEPAAHLSQAMFRVSRALKNYAPDEIEVVNDPKLCDLRVLHVIGQDVLTTEFPYPFAVIQYCLKTAGGDIAEWQKFWEKAALVWSYYDLPYGGDNALKTPLGIDPAFRKPFFAVPRSSVMTSGYVSGPGAEAIVEVATAARLTGLPVVHLGPHIEGVTGDWKNVQGIDDIKLAEHYRNARWVSGLRYGEGFEMPVIEGLACGARPICFDRPDMRQWYNGHATFIPEVTGGDLVQELVKVLSFAPEPVTREERERVLEKFSWENIVHLFWKNLIGRMASV